MTFKPAPLRAMQPRTISHTFLWVDTQSTSLEAHEGGQILELALAWVDDSREGDFRIVAELSDVFPFGPTTPPMDSKVSRLHQQSGLTRECTDASAIGECTDPDSLLGAMLDAAGAPARDVRIAGWDASRELRWLKACCPVNGARLHYLAFDVATLEIACGAWVDGYHPQRPTAKRSAENLRQTIGIACAARSALLVGCA